MYSIHVQYTCTQQSPGLLPPAASFACCSPRQPVPRHSSESMMRSGWARRAAGATDMRTHLVKGASARALLRRAAAAAYTLCLAMQCDAMQCHLLLPRCTVHHTEAGASRRSRCWEQCAARDSGMKKRRRSGAHTRVAPLTRMRRFHTSLRATKSDARRAVFCAAAVHVPARLPLSGLAWTHLVIIV